VDPDAGGSFVVYNRRTAATEAQQPPRGRFSSRNETNIKLKRKGKGYKPMTTRNGHSPTTNGNKRPLRH
jgi:hypothetical protein